MCSFCAEVYNAVMAHDPIKQALDAHKSEETTNKTGVVDSFQDKSDQLTYGPTINGLDGSYEAGAGAWSVHYLQKLSPDLLLIHLSKLAQVYRKTDSTNVSAPISRKFKDLLLKDRYPSNLS